MIALLCLGPYMLSIVQVQATTATQVPQLRRQLPQLSQQQQQANQVVQQQQRQVTEQLNQVLVSAWKGSGSNTNLAHYMGQMRGVQVEVTDSACCTSRVLHQHLATRSCSKHSQQAATQGGGPDISCLDPALQKHWDHAANAHLGGIFIRPHSARKVRWTCDQCQDGHLHSWLA